MEKLNFEGGENVNDLQRVDKRKFNSDEEDICSGYMTRLTPKTNVDEYNSNDTKKHCTWRPPIKSDKENSLRDNSESVDFNASQYYKSQTLDEIENYKITNIVEQNTKFDNQEKDKLEIVIFPSSSSIYKIDEVISNDDSDENLSISSMETLPITIKNTYNHQVLREKCSDNEEQPSLSNDEVNKVVSNETDITNSQININREYHTCDEEVVLVKKKSSCIDDMDLENLDDQETGFVAISQEKTTLETVANNEQLNTIQGEHYLLSTEQDTNCFKNKLENYSNVISDELIGDFNEVEKIPLLTYDRDSCSSPIYCEVDKRSKDIIKDFNNKQFYNNVEKNNSIDKKDGLIEDDVFSSLCLTNSQLAKVEGDVSSAIYNERFIKSPNNWIRKNMQHKQTLTNIIKKIDQLNNTVVGAINELKVQHNCNTSK